MRNWHSLRHRAEFLRLQKNGQKWITPAFVIQLSFCGESNNPPQIGFTTTKKLGNAVIRNRCRRRLRAVCDAVIGDHALNGAQISIISRSDAETHDFQQLVRDLRWALKRLDVPRADKAREGTSDGQAA